MNVTRYGNSGYQFMSSDIIFNTKVHSGCIKMTELIRLCNFYYNITCLSSFNVIVDFI